MASKKKSKKTAEVLHNHIAIILDRSGSMTSLRRGAVETLNKNISAIKENAKKTGQKTYVTFYTFANDVSRSYFEENPEWINTINECSFNPGGCTAFFDAVDNAIVDFSCNANFGLKNHSFLVIAITDGEENSSRRTNAGMLLEKIKTLQATDRWTFAFALPRGYKEKFVSGFGIPEGNINEWDQTELGIQTMSIATTAGVDAYYCSRSVGEGSTKSFYTTDLSNVKVSTVKKALDDVSKDVRVWEVEKECEIRDFCESKLNQVMLKGAAFYELTKKEKKIQDYKNLLIMERVSGKVYHGDAARDLLGLPDTGVLKVVPGNHSKFRVFVQSTSTNRKLVRGTKVVYYKAMGVPFKEGKSAK
ncbi:MAG: vWA domain-containing protein [Candidatus Shapirobacteria bacterium]|jgi:hypothetical protein